MIIDKNNDTCTHVHVGLCYLFLQSHDYVVCSCSKINYNKFIREGGSLSLFRDGTGFYGFWPFSGV